ncbi:MAG: hypothetical protein ACFFBD_24675 [Candidatus Hodarchaeota archaeon]
MSVIMEHQSKNPNPDENPLEKIPAPLRHKKSQKDVQPPEMITLSFPKLIKKVLVPPQEGMGIVARTSDIVRPLIIFFVITALIGIATLIEYLEFNSSLYPRMIRF